MGYLLWECEWNLTVLYRRRTIFMHIWKNVLEKPVPLIYICRFPGISSIRWFIIWAPITWGIMAFPIQLRLYKCMSISAASWWNWYVSEVSYAHVRMRTPPASRVFRVVVGFDTLGKYFTPFFILIEYECLNNEYDFPIYIYLIWLSVNTSD